MVFYISIYLSFYIYWNIFLLDQKLTGKNDILGKPTENEKSDFTRIKSEATLITKEVSNLYSEALDALKSKWLILIILII